VVSSRFDSSADTKLAAASDEVKQYVEKRSGEHKQPFSFITECFFLTLRSLHLGSCACRDNTPVAIFQLLTSCVVLSATLLAGMLRTFGQYNGILRLEMEQKSVRDSLLERQQQETGNHAVLAEIATILEKINVRAHALGFALSAETAVADTLGACVHHNVTGSDKRYPSGPLVRGGSAR
jgi:hypothetical protein